MLINKIDNSRQSTCIKLGDTSKLKRLCLLNVKCKVQLSINVHFNIDIRRDMKTHSADLIYQHNQYENMVNSIPTTSLIRILF